MKNKTGMNVRKTEFCAAAKKLISAYVGFASELPLLCPFA